MSPGSICPSGMPQQLTQQRGQQHREHAGEHHYQLETTPSCWPS